MLHACLLLAALVQLAPSGKNDVIQAAGRDAMDGKTGKKPVLLVEGTAKLPDRALLNVNVYSSVAVLGRELGRMGQAEVRDGKFSKEVVVGLDRLLPGVYTVLLIFEPALQRPGAAGLPAQQLEIKVQIGTVAQAEEARARCCKELADEIGLRTKLADEIEERYRRDKGKKLDEKSWDAYIDKFTMDLVARDDALAKKIEYKFLNLDGVVYGGLHEMMDVLRYVAQCQKALLAHPNDANAMAVVRAARINFNRTVQSWMKAVVPPTGDLKAMTALAEDLLRLLRAGLDARDAEAARTSHQDYFRAALALDKKSPEIFHPGITKMMADAAPYFEALQQDKEKAKALFGPLEQQIREMLEDFEALK